MRAEGAPPAEAQLVADLQPAGNGLVGAVPALRTGLPNVAPSGIRVKVRPCERIPAPGFVGD